MPTVQSGHMASDPAIQGVRIAAGGGWVLLIGGISISAALFLVSGGDILLKVAGMVLLWMLAAIGCGGRLSHPFMFFAFFYVLYAISGPLLIYFDLHPFVFWGERDVTQLDFSYVLDLEWLGLIVILLIVGPRHYDVPGRQEDANRDLIFAGAWFVFILSSCVLSGLLADIYLSGLSSKGEITLYGSWLTKLGFAYNTSVVAATVVIYKLISSGKKRQAAALLLLVAAFALLSIFISGQRNFLFRFILSAFMLVHLTVWRIRWPALMVAIPIGLLAIYWLGDQKMAWVSDAMDELPQLQASAIPFNLPDRYIDLVGDPEWLQYLKFFLISGLGTELLTASNNLAIVVERVPHDLGYLYGRTLLINDIGRAILPGFLVGNDLPTTGTLYQETFFPEYFAVGEGPGFTLLGAGYMNFGVPGVILVAGLMALMLKFAYRWAAISSMGFMFFLGFVPIAVYATRMDLTSPISQGLKHVLLPLFAMTIVGALRSFHKSYRA